MEVERGARFPLKNIDERFAPPLEVGLGAFPLKGPILTIHSSSDHSIRIDYVSKDGMMTGI